jgi:transaldolase
VQGLTKPYGGKEVAMTKLHELFEQVGQSPWVDNLRRAAIESGELSRAVDDGIRGVTSNPTIFQKSVSEGDLYDAELSELLRDRSVEEAYWEMAIADVSAALGLLRPVYDQSEGGDGFVSIEVAASLAHDTAGTIEAARSLSTRIARPNLLVKIPATAEGVPAVRQMIAEGRSVNITLIFSLARYEQVIDAYLAGLEDYDGDLSRVHSVASFFVSRVDTEVDRCLEAIATPEAMALRGKAAVAQAKLAYRLFRERFSGPRWEALAARGARLQRPLWASTSTKNPAYPDLLYVEPLMGPDTINTMPEATIEALCAHGTVACTVDQDADEAQAVLSGIEAVGVDLSAVAETLESQGVASFEKSYDDLVAALEDKAGALRAATT